MDSLHFLSGPLSGQTLPLRDTQILGRGGRADIRIEDASVSREHARLSCGQDGWTLVDLGSSNGSSINGAKLARGPVPDGAVITLGTIHARLQCAAKSAPVEQPAAGASASADDVQAVGRSAGAAVIRSKAAAVQGRGEDFSQYSAAKKAALLALLALLCAGLFYGAYLLV